VFLALMPAVCASAVSLWIAAWVAIPHKPFSANEVQALVYSRLIGRQQRLVALALVGTAMLLITVIVAVSQSLQADADRAVSQAITVPVTAPTPQPTLQRCNRGDARCFP
jgi:hypothetical protein